MVTTCRAGVALFGHLTRSKGHYITPVLKKAASLFECRERQDRFTLLMPGWEQLH